MSLMRSARPRRPGAPAPRRGVALALPWSLVGALLAVLAGALLAPAQAQTAPPTAGAGPAPAAAASPVVLSGTIVNKTAGGSVPAGMVVTATEIDAAATKEVARTVATASPSGAFHEPALPGQPGDQFALSTDYLGVTYVAQAKPPTATAIPIYETTTDSSVLSVTSETLTVLTSSTANTFNIIQLMRVHNSSDRTYIGTPDPKGTGVRQTLELPVPAQVSNFQAGPGVQGSVTVAPDGMPAASDPILPGDTDISYFYDVKVANSGWPMSRPIIYPTAREEILLAPGLTLNGPGLSLRQHVTIQGKSYANYQGGALAPGTTLSANVTLTSSASPLLWIVLGILLVLVVGAAFALPRLFRKRKQEPAPATDEAPTGGRDALIDQIAALDEAHEAGTVSDEAYAARRAGLKARLLSLAGDEPGDIPGPGDEPGDKPGPGDEPESGDEPGEAAPSSEGVHDAAAGGDRSPGPGGADPP